MMHRILSGFPLLTSTECRRLRGHKSLSGEQGAWRPLLLRWRKKVRGEAAVAMPSRLTTINNRWTSHFRLQLTFCQVNARGLRVDTSQSEKKADPASGTLIQPSYTILKRKVIWTNLHAPMIHARSFVLKTRRQQLAVPEEFERASVERPRRDPAVSAKASLVRTHQEPRMHTGAFTDSAANSSRINVPLSSNRARPAKSEFQPLTATGLPNRLYRRSNESRKPRAFEQTVDSSSRVFRKRTLTLATSITRFATTRGEASRERMIDQKQELAWKRSPRHASSESKTEVVRPNRVSVSASGEASFDHADETNRKQVSPRRTVAGLQDIQLREMTNLSPQLIDRLADDVMRRVERRIRIDKERRGI